MLAGLGLSAVVMRSAEVFTVVKLVGAAYLTLAPQFLTASHVSVRALLVLVTAHVLVMATWLSVWGVALSGARRLITMQGLKTWVNRVGGAVLIALGVRTAATAWSR